jgi:hypothetical protein
MFDVREQFKKWAEELAAKENDRRRDNHIEALKNWARNVREQNSSAPPPVSPFRVRAFVDYEKSLIEQFIETDEFASYIDPQKFIGIPATDNPDFGNSPVGLQIPGTENRFYKSSHHTHVSPYTPGKSVVTVGDRVFKLKSDGAFTTFWEEIL